MLLDATFISVVVGLVIHSRKLPIHCENNSFKDICRYFTGDTVNLEMVFIPNTPAEVAII